MGGLDLTDKPAEKEGNKKRESDKDNDWEDDTFSKSKNIICNDSKKLDENIKSMMQKVEQKYMTRQIRLGRWEKNKKYIKKAI